MSALQRFIDSYCSRHGLAQEKGRAFFEILQQEAFSTAEGVQQMLTEVASGAQRLWTSGKKPSGVSARYAKELC
eukprot:COSAG05_NODE_9824_length_598_cov_3.781563_2_plen_73_part_01